MEMREQRVAQGGLFHSHKVKYSKETQDLLHRLIEESKLSIIQRKAIKESVKKGEPLPGPERSVSGRSHSDTALRRGDVLVPPALPRRRSYQAIVKSGAYQREAFDPPYNTTLKNREEEKQKLQTLMTYGKDIPADPLDIKFNHRRNNTDEQAPVELFDHLVDEIRERLEFLQEMEGLGQARVYRPVIEQEVAAKMRQLASLDRSVTLDKITSTANVSSTALPRKTVSLENNIFPRD